MSSNSDQHLAAVLPAAGSALEVTHRKTPTPGPNELLIGVKSVALNPVDYYQRDRGIFLTQYPAVLGSDVAGIVLSTGSDVSPDAPQPGTRVAAFATGFYEGGNPDYGSLQTRVLASASMVVVLPDSITFNEASLLPMSVATALGGWYSIGLPRDTLYKPADKQALLVWGGASSVGSGAIQSAKEMGFHVYATASPVHHAYLKSLGAAYVFDYHSPSVEQDILRVTTDHGHNLATAFHAVGQLPHTIQVLSHHVPAKCASAVPVPEDTPHVEGVEVKFVMAPVDAKERSEHFRFVFWDWLRERLADGRYVPSPAIRVVEGGLGGAQRGLDELSKGVSGVKIVLEL